MSEKTPADSVQVSIHDVTRVTVTRREMRDRPECLDYDSYHMRIHATTSGGHHEVVTLTLFAEPGADIGLRLLVHGDGETYNTGYADGVASKGDETGYCGEASKGDA